jgi:ParB-like chromosome segregation protein Spo0J
MLMEPVQLVQHQAAKLFPPMDAAAFKELKADIKANGQLSPIIVIGDLILDGSNRYRACLDLKIEPKTVEWDGSGGTPLAFVVAMNLKRRHLSASQRALIAARMVNVEVGRPSKSAEKTEIGSIKPIAVTVESISEQLDEDRAFAVSDRGC